MLYSIEMANTVESKSTFTFCFLLFGCFSLSKADGEIFCCNGWDDQVDKMIVSKHKNTTECMAWQRSDGSKVAIEYSSNDVDHAQKAGRREEDCFKWTPEGYDTYCSCRDSWCNCPDTFRNQQPKPKPTGLQCCNNRNANSTIKKVTCPDTLPQPLGCTAFGDRNDPLIRMECGLGTRFADNCTAFVLKHPPSPLLVRCHCQTDFCNCPYNSTNNSFHINHNVAETRLIVLSILFLVVSLTT